MSLIFFIQRDLNGMENSNIGDSKEAILLLLLIKVRVEKQSGIIYFFFYK